MQVTPGNETLVAAVTNLVLSRKQALRRGSQAYLDGTDITKIMRIIEILVEPPPPPQADTYGRPQSDTIPTGDALADELGDTARRSLRARLDGQQPIPKE